MASTNTNTFFLSIEFRVFVKTNTFLPVFAVEAKAKEVQKILPSGRVTTGLVTSFIANWPKIQSKASGDDSISAAVEGKVGCVSISARMTLIASEFRSLVERNIYSFLRQNVSTKFHITGKLSIPFVFEGANMSLKMRTKASWYFRKTHNGM